MALLIACRDGPINPLGPRDAPDWDTLDADVIQAAA
jgi:hypothetical protein